MAINNKDLEELLNLTRDTITADYFINTFAHLGDNPPKILTTDKLTIPAGRYKNNRLPIETRVGIYVFNKIFIHDNLYGILGYINNVIDSGELSKIQSALAKNLLNDTITIPTVLTYLNDMQWFGFSFNSMLTSSISERTLIPLDSVMKEKERLFKVHEEEIGKGNAVVAAKIEKELLDIARAELKGDAGMEMYDSGSKVKFGNSYKNMNVMKGPMRNTITGKFTISKSNYMNGVDKDELELYGDAIVEAAYSKGKETQVAGYMTKKFSAGFQSIVLDEPGSDCNSKGTFNTTLYADDVKMFMYRYIVEGGKLVLLDDSNISKYVGKDISLRSPLYCTTDKICSKCAGELYYKLGIMTIGLTTTRVSSTLLNMGMKKFHDVSVHVYEADVNDLVL